MKKDLLKFPLKRVLLSTVILCSLSAIISSCGEEEGRISVNDAAPEKVTNITTKARDFFDAGVDTVWQL